MFRYILLLVLLFGTGRLGGAEPSGSATTSATRALTAEEFARSGLNKLTPEELAFLDAALARHHSEVGQRAPVPANSTAKRPPSKEKIAADFGVEQVAQSKPVNDADELHTHIEGTIQEFSGRTVFVLANGQIWQQRTPTDVFLPKKLVNPAVTLTRGAFGYKMVIDDANIVVFVKRVQ